MLRALAGRVVTIERRASLAEKARAALAGQGLGDVKVVVGDGTLGWPEEAPYDAIVVTAAGPAPPPPLLEQPAPRGRPVMPVGSRHHDQFLMRYTRPATGDLREDGDPAPAEDYRSERLTPVRFVPLIGAHGFGPDR